MPSENRKPLEPQEVQQALARLHGWSGNEHGIDRKFTFRDFREAMRFMQACAEGIDQRDHHPVWTNKYNTLDVHLDTFDAGHRVTKKDIDLAEFLDAKLAEYQRSAAP